MMRTAFFGFLAMLGGWAHAQLPAPGVLPTTMRVDALHADAAALQGVIVKVTGIQRVETTEVSEGLYQLTIWGLAAAPCFRAVLPFKRLEQVKQSNALFVSVKDSKTVPPALTILGNTIVYADAVAPLKIDWVAPSQVELRSP